jgi:hypothetical protein
MAIEYRVPELLRGARVRLSTGAYVRIPRRGFLALSGRRRGRANVFSLSVCRELRDLGFTRHNDETMMDPHATTNSAHTPPHAVADPRDGVRSIPADGNMPHGPPAQPVPPNPGAQNPGATHPLPNSRPAPVPH